MLHPRLTSLDGTQVVWLAQIGAWGDITWQTRWGDASCGMYEASWPMNLPRGFSHPMLKRGTLVELMDGPLRVGSPLVLSSPAVGSSPSEPWTITCTGIARDVEGEHSFYAIDSGTGASTSVPTTAATYAKAQGWRIAGNASSVPTGATGGSSTSDELMTCGSLFKAAGDVLSQRWGVNSDNYLFFAADPSTPTYFVSPETVALGSGDDGYATVVLGRYHDSSVDAYLTVTATDTQVDSLFGRKQYAADLIPLGAISAAVAQAYVDGILAKTKGRLAWMNNMTLTSNQILDTGGQPANLTAVAENVGRGCMFRLYGVWDDLLAFNGALYLDVVMGQSQLVDGGQQIQLSPLGLTPTDFAAVMESVTGMAASAA